MQEASDKYEDMHQLYTRESSQMGYISVSQ